MYVMRRRVVLAALLAVGVVGIVPTAQAGPASVELTVTQGQGRLPVAAAGKHMLYTDTGTNVGKGTATQVTLTHAVSSGEIELARVVEGSGTCLVTDNDSLVTCKLGNLKSDQFFTVDVLVLAPSEDFENTVQVTTNEGPQDNQPAPKPDPKPDTSMKRFTTEVRAPDNDFNADCFTTAPGSPLTTDNFNIGATAANPVVTILQFTTIAGLTATCVSLEEVLDPLNEGGACPTGVTCVMTQFSEALFPTPPAGEPATIKLIIDVTVPPFTVLYSDGEPIPPCPMPGTITSGKCLMPIVPLPNGDREATVIVVDDFRLRG
jgi:Domain of unknown function DUF11